MQSVCFDIGIREPLQSEDVDSIFNFINRNFGLLNLIQIKEAFELFSADRLTFADPKFGHYNSFDNTFIGKVLSSYKTYIVDYNFRNKHKQKPIEDASKLIEVKRLSKEENAQQWYDWVLTEIKDGGKVPMMADWDALYWILTKEKKIVLDTDSKEMFMDNVKFEIQEEIVFRKAEKRDYRNYTRMLESDDSLQRECRKRIVIKHLEK